MRRSAKSLAAMALLFIAAEPAIAQSTIAFQFDTVIDATQVGGGPATPVRATFSFLPDLAPGSGPFGTTPSSASYGPISLTLQMGTDSVSVSGSGNTMGIGVFNDAGTTVVEDSYSVGSSFEASYSGRLFGFDVTNIDIHLIDSNLDMFTSADLPLDPGFAERADQSYLMIFLTDDVGGPVVLSNFGQNAPFSLTVAPPPPPPMCVSHVTTVSELHSEVAGLHTSAGAKEALSGILDEVQAALDAGRRDDGRNGLGRFIRATISRSTREEGRPGRLLVAEANHLVCSAANVVTGIPGQ